MFGIGPATRIYLAAGPTDMRKGFEGLFELARDRLSCDPLSGHVFLFSNAQRNRGLVARKLFGSTCAWSPQRINTWRKWSAIGVSEWTFIIG